MTFLDNLSEIISEKGKEAAGAAKRIAEIANLKGQISGMETEIKKNYRKIGEAYYEAYKEAEVTCEFEEYVQAIRDTRKAIDELKRKVNELKGDRECKGCGSLIKSDSMFCPKCGTKVETDFFDDEDTEEISIQTVLDDDEDTEEISVQTVSDDDDTEKSFMSVSEKVSVSVESVEAVMDEEERDTVKTDSDDEVEELEEITE